MNEFFERLFGVKNNNIRPTRNQLRVPRNNIRSGPVSKGGKNMLDARFVHEMNVFENKHLTNLFKKSRLKYLNKSGSKIGRASLVMPYIEAVKTAVKTGQDAKQTRKEGREQLFKNITKPVRYVQMPNPRPFSPEMYAP